MRWLTIFPLAAPVILAAGCATAPENIDDLCAVFREYPDWYESAKDSSHRWGVPIPVMMSIVHQESRFEAGARPPRTKILWIFPGPRPSSAYGYAQVVEDTWNNYIQSTGNEGADRDDFEDVIDFLGWYCRRSQLKCGISTKDPYHQYLAFHEGQEGFNQRTYANKSWLMEVARKVRAKAVAYSRQLNRCWGELNQPKKRFLGIF